jgi:DNA-binding NarL/FixJ family response regulator
LLFRKADSDGSPDFAKLSIPRASVFVIETQPRDETTAALAGSVLAAHPMGRLVVVGEKFTEETAFPLLRLGAKGLLTYGEVDSQLDRALRVIASAGFWVPRALLSRFVEHTLSSSPRPRALPVTRRLSRRETEVMELLLQNFSNKEIASRLNFSSRTAKFHVSNLLAKHGVRRRADLILLAHGRSEP